MLRVRHTINTATGLLLQFRDYKANGYKLEVQDPKLNRKIATNLGSWLCTFVRPESVLNKSKMETSFISSKKKIIKKFKEFILADFPKIDNREENGIIGGVKDTLDKIHVQIRSIRKAIENSDKETIDILIPQTICELDNLQTKISEMEVKK